MATKSRSLIGIVGDFDASNETHRLTNEALTHAGINYNWVPTEAIGGNPAGPLARFDGLWIAPASPYRNMDGALSAIRYARERGVPLVGT